MHKNNETLSPKESQVPQWLREYKTSYQAFKMVEESMHRELGNRDQSKGNILDDFQKDYAKTFFTGIAPIAYALPEFIQYRWIRPPRPNFSINGAMISVAPIESDCYYLPQTDSIYQLGVRAKNDPKFIPGNPHFLGFDNINAQHEYFARVMPLNHFEHRERVANPLDISIDGLDLIVAKAEEALNGKPEQSTVDELKRSLAELKKQTEEKRKEAEERWTPQIKQRIFNLLDFFQRHPSFDRKLPKMIEGQVIFDEEWEKGNRKRNFLKKETRELVRVPVEYKKPLLKIIERSGENADFSKAEPALESDWIRTSGFLVNTMRHVLGPLTAEQYNFLYE
jgi:hypothetical protein